MQRKILILFASLAFGFSLWSLVTYTTRETAKREAYFQEQEKAASEGSVVFSGPYCFPDRHPQFLMLCSLLLLINLISMIGLRRPALPFLFAISAFAVFPFWFYATRQAIAMNETVPPLAWDRILYRATEFDVFVFGLVTIIVTWQGALFLGWMVSVNKRESPPTLK